ncbi:MAG: hypothetical protein AAGC55_23135, partial [Myxococcota bacterium]
MMGWTVTFDSRRSGAGVARLSVASRAVGLVAVAVVLGCGSAPTPVPPQPPVSGGGLTPPPAPTEPSAVTEPEVGLVSAEAVGATRDEAYAAAHDALAAELYGSPAWAEAMAGMAIPVHDRERDIIRFEDGDDGQVRAVLGLRRDRVAEALAAAADKPWSPRAPAPLAEVLVRAAAQHWAHVVCLRRRALLEDPCQPVALDEVAAEVAAVAARVRLRSAYFGGLPVTGDGRSLRPVTVVAELSVGGGARALEGLPLSVERGAADRPEAQPDESASAVTEANGLARFPDTLGAEWSAGGRVVVDRQALLGPVAELWPDTAVAVPGRSVGKRRWLLYSIERVQGRPASARIFASTMYKAYPARGAEPAYPAGRSSLADLHGRSAAEIATALGQRLPSLADRWQGAVDIAVVAEVDSDFVRRMGAHRMWYEARARAVVYDVWTGRPLTTIEESIEASGVGDSRA